MISAIDSLFKGGCGDLLNLVGRARPRRRSRAPLGLISCFLRPFHGGEPTPTCPRRAAGRRAAVVTPTATWLVSMSINVRRSFLERAKRDAFIVLCRAMLYKRHRHYQQAAAGRPGSPEARALYISLRRGRTGRRLHFDVTTFHICLTRSRVDPLCACPTGWIEHTFLCG